MNDDANAGGRAGEAGAPAGTQGPERAIDPVLLNAIADVTVEGGGDVVPDARSRTALRDALDEATDEDERERFRDAVGSVHAEGEGGADARQAVATVVDAVREHLADRDARVVVDHESHVSLDPGEVAVYNFARSKDPAALADVELPDAVGAHVTDGADRVADGDFAAAAKAFTSAVDAAGTGDGAVLTRTLAGWAHHWAGEDRTAIDFVEEALHLHAGAWGPTLVGYSADPEPSFARPEQFREGKYGAMPVLRYTIDCPEGTDVTPFFGRVGDDGVVQEWTELEGTDECTPLHQLGDETVIRLELSGTVPQFPGVHSYYVGIGIADLEVFELREVYRLLLEGPQGERVTETVRIELD